MKHPAPMRFLLAGVLSASFFCCPTFGQTSRKASHCQQLVIPDPPGPEIVIDDVTLDGATDVPYTVWNQIVSEIKATRYKGTHWLDELEEVRLRGRLRDFGYFSPMVSAQAKVVTSSPTLQHVSVSAHVNAGSQYTLSKVQFRSADSSEIDLPFPAEELRSLVPLHDGDIFSVDKVRDGLDALRNYYSSRGYTDFVSTPETKIDELHQQITLVIVLQEGPQFRLGNIEVLGLDSALENELRSKIRSGDLVNFQLIVDFYQEHKAELPDEDSPEDTAFTPHIKEGIVDALFDFRSCAQLQK